jgi:hypothetical protein
VRASGGLFYDNFLLQNTYQDRINRLSNGQYNRSLTLCPTGSVLFPNGSVVSSVTIFFGQPTLDIATQICGQPIGSAWRRRFRICRKHFLAAQSAVTGGPERLLAGQQHGGFWRYAGARFQNAARVHMSALEFSIRSGERGMFSADYVREIGTQFPLGIDTNHVGDASYLTDGDNSNPLMNNYAAELSAINATVTNRGVGCGPATIDGWASSQAAVNCYLKT